MLKTAFRILIALFAVMGIAVFVLAAWIASYFIWPDISWLKNENPKKTAFMELREKEWKEKGRKVALRHNWVWLEEISPFLQDAVIISEDDKFWDHSGIDFSGIQEALEKDLKKGQMRAGGSTITQQLAKNLFLSPERSFTRKLKEAVLTFRLERTLGKKRILELYLNSAEWGDGIFGIEAASRFYFGKPSKELGPEEASRLAVVLPNPLRFRPNGDSRYIAKRALFVQRVMEKRGEGATLYDEMIAPPETPAAPPPGDEIGPAPELPSAPTEETPAPAGKIVSEQSPGA